MNERVVCVSVESLWGKKWPQKQQPRYETENCHNNNKYKKKLRANETKII